MALLKTYSITTDLSGGYDLKLLDDEIVASGHVTNPDGLAQDGDNLKVLGDALANGSGLDAIIAAHSPLEANKQKRLREINKKDKELIENGFAFDSQTFSLSDKGRSDWLGLKTLEALLTWPVTITTLDNGSYSLTQANLNSFLGLGLGTYQAILDSGRTLKVAINAATTQAELDAVVDTR